MRRLHCTLHQIIGHKDALCNDSRPARILLPILSPNINVICITDLLASNLLSLTCMGNTKVAVPEHQGRIAPVFDCCRSVSIFSGSVHGHELVGIEDWSALPRMARPGRLRELGVDCVLCGGISCGMEIQIASAGIKLIPWLAGDVHEVLTAFRQGRLEDPRFAMPGTMRCRARRGRGRRLMGTRGDFTKT